MINICVINGSPRRKNSNSKYITDTLLNFFDNKVNSKTFYVSDILKDTSLFDEIITYNNILITSPLYADSFPSATLDFLWQFGDFLSTKDNLNINLYGIVNSGFNDGNQNRIAVNILKNFANSSNLNWKAGIGLGSGEMLKGMESAPWQKGPKKPVYNAFMKLKNSIENDSNIDDDIILATLKFPKRLFIMVANHGWKQQCKKNYGVKPRELYKQIY